MKKLKRTAIFLAVFIIAMGMMNTAAFAEEADETVDAGGNENLAEMQQTEQTEEMRQTEVTEQAEQAEAQEVSDAEDTYIYVYNDEEHWSISPHLTSVEYSDGNSDIIFPDMFLLDTVEEDAADANTVSAAYCCDIRTGIETEKLYRRVNLEDSTYFDDAAAAQLRGVVTNGYWHDWEDKDVTDTETAVNQWLAAQGKNESISGLTRAEALTATQAAIWYVAENMAGNGDITEFLPYSRTVYMSYWDPDELVIDQRVDIHEKASENTKRNIELLYEYLLTQPAKNAATVLFTDEHFISSKTASRGLYDVTLNFKLAGTVGDKDDLKLTAALGNRSVMEYLLTGGERITPDVNGFYSIVFSNVTEEELKSMIKLSIAGRQMMNGVCFYEAKPVDGSSARETSQNLIGKISGLTSVYAEDFFELGALITENDEPEETVPMEETKEVEKEPIAGMKEVKKAEQKVETVNAEAAGISMDEAVETGDDASLLPWFMTAVGAVMAAMATMLMGRAGKE